MNNVQSVWSQNFMDTGKAIEVFSFVYKMFK